MHFFRLFHDRQPFRMRVNGDKVFVCQKMFKVIEFSRNRQPEQFNGSIPIAFFLGIRDVGIFERS